MATEPVFPVGDPGAGVSPLSKSCNLIGVLATSRVSGAPSSDRIIFAGGGDGDGTCFPRRRSRRGSFPAQQELQFDRRVGDFESERRAFFRSDNFRRRWRWRRNLFSPSEIPAREFPRSARAAI